MPNQPVADSLAVVLKMGFFLPITCNTPFEMLYNKSICNDLLSGNGTYQTK
jgi:hypothetical protein